MKKNVKIVSVQPEKTGTNERGEWCITDMRVQWQEDGANGEPFVQETVVSVSGWLNKLKLSVLMENNSTVNMTMYFGVREYQGKLYCSNRAYLPKELMCESREESLNNTPL